MTLSIIIPVFNVEQYVRPCLESVFKQGLDERCFEVIVINDGTEDRSMEMISDIISDHPNISVIEQANQGVSSARNLGIARAKGEYVFMLDGDDLLIENRLPFLLDCAVRSGADVVMADFLRMNSEEISHYLSGQAGLPGEKDGSAVEKSGPDLFVQDLSPYQCYPWRILFRRDHLLRHHIIFPSERNYEDIPFVCEAFIRAQKCLRVSWIANIYRFPRAGSAVSSFNRNKLLYFCQAIAHAWQLRQIKGLSEPVKTKLMDVVFCNFQVIVPNTKRCMKTPSDRRHIIDSLRQMAPDMYFDHGCRQRIVSFIWRKTPGLLFFSSDVFRLLFSLSLRIKHPGKMIRLDYRRLFHPERKN